MESFGTIWSSWKQTKNIRNILETASIRHWYPLYLVIDDAMQMTGLGLKREELEKLVIDLYYNQNKTFREVQKTVRKSPGDIRLILDKANPHSKSNNSKQTHTLTGLSDVRRKGHSNPSCYYPRPKRERNKRVIQSGGISVVCMNY